MFEYFFGNGPIAQTIGPMKVWFFFPTEFYRFSSKILFVSSKVLILLFTITYQTYHTKSVYFCQLGINLENFL